MQWRRLIIAIVAATALGGLAVLALQPAPIATPLGPVAAMPVLRGQINTADRIELQQGKAVLWLERRGQVWGVSQEGGYPISPQAAASLIDGLLGLTLDHPASGTPAALGVADPNAPAGAGTLVRILATSGALLGSLIVGAPTGPAYVREVREDQVWLASRHIPVSTAPADWTGTHLPPLDAGSTTPATIQQAIAGLSFTDVRPSPQLHLTAARSTSIALADGTAVLILGQAAGGEWLEITGSSAWARRLSPYAFAVPSSTQLGPE